MTTVFALTGLSPRRGAASEEVGRAEQALGVRFPGDYRLFLSASDGLEGGIGGDKYLMLFRIEDIAEINVAAATSEFAPGFVIIGSDGGGTSYGFRWHGRTPEYGRVTDMELSNERIEVLGASLMDMIQRIVGA